MNEKIKVVANNKKIKCLFIGNSVCQDHVAYLPWLFKNIYPEIDFEIYLAYRASLTIKDYVLHVITGEVPLRIFSVAKNTSVWTNYNELEGHSIYFDEMFNFAKFDIIAFEGFFHSHNEDISYYKTFLDYIKTKQKEYPFKVGYLLHQTYKEDVYNDIIQSVIPAIKTVPISMVFPCGVVTELVNGIIPQSTLTNDDIHNQQGLPCIMGAYTIMSMIAEYLGLPERIINNPLRISSSEDTALNIPGRNGSFIKGTETQWKLCQDAAIKAINYAKYLIVNYKIEDILSNPEWISLETDSNGNVLSGLHIDGKKYENIPINFMGTDFEVIDNPEWSSIVLDFKGRVIEGIYKDGRKYIYEKETTNISPKPMVTIIDDDGRYEFKTLLLPIVERKKVPIASAVIGEWVDNETHGSMSWNDIAECIEKGAEIISHTYCHLAADVAENMTQIEIQNDYQIMDNILALHGIKNTGLVFAGASATREKCINACKLVYDYAFLAGQQQGVNYKDIFEPYSIIRNSFHWDNDSIQFYKNMIDTMVQKKTGWLVFMTHTSDSQFDQSAADILENLIDYCISHNIDIVTTKCGFKNYKN